MNEIMETVVDPVDQMVTKERFDALTHMKKIYKVIFSYKQDSPCGGNDCTTGWTKETKLYDVDNAPELQSQIDKFLSDDKCGYRRYIKVVDIAKL